MTPRKPIRPAVGVLLSGCGFRDGSEIHEAVLTLLFLDRAGAEAVCMAPHRPQAQVVDHATGEVVHGESRDMLREAARLARGRIRDVATVRAGELDGLIMPGGYGAALNLCDFARSAARPKAMPEVTTLLRELHRARKPIGAICIAPALLATVLGEHHPELTIGADKGTAARLEQLGARHRDCPVEGFVADPEQRIVSTPAYMYDARISEVAAGIERLVATVVDWCRSAAPAGATS